MFFTIDEEKKRTWNRGWWRRRRKGKVFVGTAAAIAAAGAALLAYGALNGGFFALLERASLQDVGFRASQCVGYGLGLLLAAVALAGNIARVSRLPPAIKAEALTIENGILLYRCQVPGAVPKGKVHVCRARLDECFWYWEPKREQVVIWIDKDHIGAIMCGNVPVASAGAIDDSMLGEFAGGLGFSPWFEPDLAGELRRLGVPERELPAGRRFLNGC